MGESGDYGHALKNGEGSQIKFRGTRMVVKVSGEQSEGAYTLIDMTYSQDAGPACMSIPEPPKHIMYWKASTLSATEKEILGKVGDFVFIPKGVPHNYRSGPRGGKVLVVSPAGLEKYFAQVAGMLKE